MTLNYLSGADEIDGNTMFWEREHQMRSRSEGYIEHRVSKRPTRGEVKQNLILS